MPAAAPAIWWIKLDFRLHDNPALTAALAAHERVVPVFAFEPRVLRAAETSGFHVAAWCEALVDLRTRLRKTGGDVLVVEGDAPEVLAKACELTGARHVYSHEEIGTELTFARDREVGAWAEASGVAWHEHMQTGVFRGGIDRDRRHRAWKKFMDAGPLPTPPAEDLARVGVPEVLRELELQGPLTPERFGHPLTEAQWAQRQPVSETAAGDTLRSFLYERGACYSFGISSPNLAFACGSRLSVHFAWGTTTGRAAYHALEQRRAELKDGTSDEAKQWRRSLTAFRSRLHWRDHFTQRLEAEPSSEFVPINRAYEALPTPGDVHFDDWLHGRTGWPMVDACMRCAATTGFLNFRMRAMVTSVAVHSLRIDWRRLIHPVARLWADYAPGIHVSQTQMQAGVVGINQLRGYSPDKQLLDHDAEATFVKTWIPELRDATPAEIKRHTGGDFVAGYRPPLIDRIESFKAFKADYYGIKRLPETKALAEEVYARHGSRRSPASRTWRSNVPKGARGANKKAGAKDKSGKAAATPQGALFGG